MDPINKIRLLAFILLSGKLLFGQHVTIVATPPQLKPHRGYIMLNNKDTLQGMILMGERQKGATGIRIERNNTTQFISDKDLKYIRLLAYDSFLTNSKYTEYRRLTGKPKLWRLIASGKIDIYDDALYSNEFHDEIGEHFLIVDKGRIKNISHGITFLKTDALFRYTNKKHHTHYKPKDFKSTKEFLQFIEDKG